VEERSSRTPEISLEDTFLIAVAGLPEEDVRAAVVAEALGHLQRGFDAHYAGGGATDDDVLVGDNSYALAVETIARLDEPRFVAVASRMIRDGAGLIAAGGAVSLQTWIPHLAVLLDIISGEGEERSEARIEEAAEEVRRRSG
jgi:methylmalonyl-CoA mutase cobalamin-binding subunit